MSKGFTQMDYVVAIGIFVIVFALVVQIVSNYFSDLTQDANIRLMTSQATDMIGIAEGDFRPESLKLGTIAYRINVRVNNSPQYWYDQGLPFQSITNELVRINFTDFGLNPDINSAAVYDDSGSLVPYEISGNRIIFMSNIPVNVVKNYTVYFDDDSNFTSQSVAQSGVDNLSEIVSQPQKIDILQYRKIIQLNSSGYSLLKNTTGLFRDFKITIVDNDNTIAFHYGGDTPNGGNIVAFRRFVLFQNSTGGVRRGYMNVQVW